MPTKPRRPIEAEDLCRIAVVGDARISPDGRRVAYVVREVDRDANAYRSTIWMVPTTDGAPAEARPFTRGATSEHHPRWSPDGRHLAFLSDRENTCASRGAKAQIWVMATDGGEARRVTSGSEAVSTFAWSPSGDRLAFIARVRPPGSAPVEGDKPPPPPVYEITRIKHKADGQGLLEGRTHLFVVPVGGAEAKQLTDGDWDDGEPAWSPDGARIAFASNRTAGRDWNDASDVWVVGANGGRAKKLTQGREALGAPAWSPDGRWVACLGRAQDAPAGANTRLWLVAAEGGPARCVTADFDRSIGGDLLSDLRDPGPDPVPFWSPDGARIRFVASDRGNAHVYEADVASGSVRRLIGGERQIISFSVSADDRRIALAASDALDPGNVSVTEGDGGGERRLTDLNGELLSGLDLAAPERLEVAGAGGQAVEGWLLPGRGRGRRPTILQIHGGPHALYGNAFMHEFQLLAARGYNVLYTNPRGSRGYGERFCSEIAGAWGELDYRDLMAAVDAVVARPDVDGARLGVAGGSYGGFMTNWIVGHTDRFKAAISMRGLSSFLSFYGTSDIGTFFGERELLGTPHEQLERYLRMSPISYVDQIQTPILILHGEQDLRCPLEQAEQLFVALRRRGKTAALLRFPEESHNMSRRGRPDRRLLRLERILAWLDRWLLNEETGGRKQETGGRAR
jgi:dipeptidyl aminopeptidase/acylaminoacyl peptidase